MTAVAAVGTVVVETAAADVVGTVVDVVVVETAAAADVFVTAAQVVPNSLNVLHSLQETRLGIEDGLV